MPEHEPALPWFHASDAVEAMWRERERANAQAVTRPKPDHTHELVWLRVPGGLEPQVWPAGRLISRERPQALMGKPQPIKPEHVGKSLDDLARLYPCAGAMPTGDDEFVIDGNARAR